MKLIIKNISHRYTRRFIFKNINLEISNNGVYIVSGNNGSGKSTFLKILSGSLKPSQGSIFIERSGNQISMNSFYKYVGFSSPYINCFDDLSLIENFDLLQLDKEENFENMLEKFQLNNYGNYKVKELSSGLYQRFRLLLTMLKYPDIVVLDEPTMNLDESGKNFMKRFIEDHKYTKIIIIATNEAEEKKWGDVLIEFS